MDRLTELTYETMTDDQRRVHDEIASGPRGRVPGPAGVWIRSPGLADPSQKMGGFLRFGSVIPARLRELSVLVVARHWTAQLEWHAHAIIAEKEGLAPEIMTAIKERRTPAFVEPAEQAVYNFTKELMDNFEVSDAAYAAVVEHLGEVGAVELVGLAGYYVYVAMTLNVFHVPVPEGATDPL